MATEMSPFQMAEFVHCNSKILDQLINKNGIPAADATKMRQIFDRAKALFKQMPKETEFKPMDRDFSKYPNELHSPMEKMQSFCLYPKLMLQMVARGYCRSMARSLINRYLIAQPDEPIIRTREFSSWLRRVNRAQLRP